MARLALLVLLLIAACTCGAAGFALPRPSYWRAQVPAPDAAQEPAQAIKPPWGLWAARAPYPYYDGWLGIDTGDDLVARDIWFDFLSELWVCTDGHRGAAGRMRARFGLFFADVSYLQLADTDAASTLDHPRVRDWAAVTDARGHLGVTIPIPILGYADFGAGLAGFDETRGMSRLGLSLRACISIYPLWPLELEAECSRALFVHGSGVNEFAARAHVQVFRHLLLTAGWRWMNVDGGDFSTHGFTLGFSFQWSNLRTFFWAPYRGPAW